MACPNTEGVETDAKGPPGTLTIGKQTFCFCGVRSGQHTLRTGLVKPPRSQLGVKRILCLTKVEGPFQSTQGSGRGPRATHYRDACRVGGRLLQQGLVARKVPPRPSQGMAGAGSCSAARAGCPEDHVRAQGDPSQLHPSGPAFVLQILASREGSPFWENEQIAIQFINLVLQMGRLRPGEEMRLAHVAQQVDVRTDLTSGPCLGKHLIREGWQS